MGLLAVILAMLAHWAFYIFSWASMAHLLSSCFFHSLLLSSFFIIRLFLSLSPLLKTFINNEIEIRSEGEERYESKHFKDGVRVCIKNKHI